MPQPCNVSVRHPETRVRRELFEVGSITDWLEPVPERALTCRVIVARQAAPEHADAVGSETLCKSGWDGERVVRAEVCERRGHAARVLHLQRVRGTGENEPFGMRQPRQEQPVRLPEAGPEGVALGAKHGEDRLGDPPCQYPLRQMRPGVGPMR